VCGRHRVSIFLRSGRVKIAPSSCTPNSASVAWPSGFSPALFVSSFFCLATHWPLCRIPFRAPKPISIGSVRAVAYLVHQKSWGRVLGSCAAVGNMLATRSFWGKELACHSPPRAPSSKTRGGGVFCEGRDWLGNIINRTAAKFGVAEEGEQGAPTAR
jgi:hypothetical protein